MTTIEYTPPFIHATLPDPNAIIIGYDDYKKQFRFVPVVRYSKGKFTFVRNRING